MRTPRRQGGCFCGRWWGEESRLAALLTVKIKRQQTFLKTIQLAELASLRAVEPHSAARVFSSSSSRITREIINGNSRYPKSVRTLPSNLRKTGCVDRAHATRALSIAAAVLFRAGRRLWKQRCLCAFGGTAGRMEFVAAGRAIVGSSTRGAWRRADRPAWAAAKWSHWRPSFSSDAT